MQSLKIDYKKIVYATLMFMIALTAVEFYNPTPNKMMYDLHVTVYLRKADTPYDQDDTYISHHPATITTIGKNWIEDQLGDTPSTQPANYISVSSSTSSPSSAWTQIPSEIATNGLSRALGTYASTGDGTWTITKEFTASGTITDAQLTGLQYGTSGDNNLLASDTFTPTSLAANDKLTIIWSNSAS